MSTTEPTARYDAFRALHHGERPLLLPNAWDHASAAALAAKGFPAIGTTSLGVAVAAGKPDAAGLTRDETVALALGLAPLPALITVDIEGGFSTDPAEVAALAAELAAGGVAGVNIEDGRPDGTLTDLALQTELITAVKETVPTLFVNARTDSYWLGTGGADATERLAGTLRRAEAFVEAGADGLFVPMLPDDDAISAVVKGVDAPLNVLFAPDRHSFGRLAELGVARVSCGSLLFRAAVHHAVELAWAIAQDGVASGAGLPSYADANALASLYDPAP
ncbi:isocitrate lyase/PEP mutase family protein [Yinghuangia seranimata]|uniref:isocitrate lyase/PEP mutase family protein n=1 Tax=Yinghuangia seranimata TaxID=408067 RepID=UPI00248C21B0|nr:isocitrate lyase/phosphoenolpyruvate mutase family protein [Yinghuangia seranimata]MDI2131105.1 isocitrate lyase/phosphoenolpyruvate mutase family protein [Yinghuangia seranimata]